MKVRHLGTLIFTAFVALPACIFLGYNGWVSDSLFDMLMAGFGLVVFVRVLWTAISQRAYDADRARLQREHTVRYAIYGRWAKFIPYIPAVMLIFAFMSPSTNPDDTTTPLLWLVLAAVTALVHFGVYCYGCYTMGLWKGNE